MGLSADDVAALDRAVRLLEFPSFASRVTDAIGTPVRLALERLPGDTSQLITTATRAAIHRALSMAVSTIRTARPSPPRVHMIASMATGLVGGALGLPALIVELPLSTIIMLRAIGEIARSEGEDLADTEARLSCIEVFALGARARPEDPGESYFAMRTALASVVTEAAGHLARHGVTHQSAPALVKFLAQIGSRFGLVVSEKVAAQAIPVLGAIGGAGINALFMTHFQDVARGHFIVRRLERVYGRRAVRTAYDATRRSYREAEEPFSSSADGRSSRLP